VSHTLQVILTVGSKPATSFHFDLKRNKIEYCTSEYSLNRKILITMISVWNGIEPNGTMNHYSPVLV
jgi:hypothetical protein